eukprot:Phypoly_transcript_13698.p1 GENE.Phypoly_transcript_13698~~Phypoly_transcript_13698.p1  ORF type:complete len:307 (+),score=40.58 Phypoly_transcript_13698:91-1011(+)
MEIALEELPLELIHHIILASNPFTFGKLAQVSKFWVAVFEDDIVWEHIYARFFKPISISPSQRYKNEVLSLCKQMQEMDANARLLWAVRKGFHNAVEHVLSTTNADIECVDDELNSRSLHIASFMGFTEVVEVLVKFRANVNATSSTADNTPLHAASSGGFIDIISILLQNKAKINVQDRFGRTPLQTAVFRSNLGAVERLLQEPDINLEIIEHNYKQTALHIASSRNFVEILNLLLESNANINAIDRDGWTPLHIACYKGNKEVVAALLAHSSLHREILAQNQSALTFAARQGYHHIVELFRTAE